jgi:hypothetical protein
MVPHKVSYEATRMVTKCVPTTETYTACRMVKHTVEKQVPCAPCAPCGCESSCGCAHESRLKGLLHKLHGHREHCDSCDTGCGCH